MTRQILRREGVRGLFIALFAEEDMAGDDAPLEKLDNVSKLLKSLPTGMDETVCLPRLFLVVKLICFSNIMETL